MPATLVDQAESYVVLRPFTAEGRTVQRGEVLDCSAWRNVQPLINTRYLAPIWSAEGRAAAKVDFAKMLDDAVNSIPDDDREVDDLPARRGPGRPRKEVK